MRRVPAKSLVLDMSLYPRETVSPEHVRRLSMALEAGADLPPVVIDKTTRTIIDGVHRTKAHQKHYGEDCDISVVEKEYKSRRDMFLDAIKYNASHGAPLTEGDRRLIVSKALEYKYSSTAVSAALGITNAAYGGLASAQKRVVELVTNPAAQPTSKSKLKRSLVELAGRPNPDASRCPDCGGKILPGTDCLKCNLADPDKRQSLERNEARHRASVETYGTRDDVGAKCSDGWQDRLATLRAAKQSGDELGFHVDWLRAWLKNNPDRDDHNDAKLSDLLDALAGYMGVEVEATL